MPLSKEIKIHITVDNDQILVIAKEGGKRSIVSIIVLKSSNNARHESITCGIYRSTDDTIGLREYIHNLTKENREKAEFDKANLPYVTNVTEKYEIQHPAIDLQITAPSNEEIQGAVTHSLLLLRF